MIVLGDVSICGIPYHVEERTTDEDHNLQNAYGYCVHGQCLIVVASGLVPELFRNTLLHEIQHAIWEHSGVRQLKPTVDDYEESFIQTFTPHWIAATGSIKKWKATK